MQAILEIIRQFWINLRQGQLPELGPWNYLLLAIMIVWQGPIATVLGGAAASAGYLKPGLVFLAGVAGNLTADILWYSVGRRGNVDRLMASRHLKAYRSRVEMFKSTMEQHAPKFLLMAKLSFGLAIPTLVAAGLTRLSWRKWFPIVFLGETIFTGSLVVAGYFTTEVLKQVDQGIQLFLVVMSFLFLLLAVWFIPRALRDSKPLQMSHFEDKK